MKGHVELSAIAIALGYLIFIVRLVRRKQLREKYAMLWVAVGTLVVLVSVSSGPMDRLARAIGIVYGPSVLFLLAIMFLMAVVTHLSWELSRVEDRTRRLAEEMAMQRPHPPASEAVQHHPGCCDVSHSGSVQ